MRRTRFKYHDVIQKNNPFSLDFSWLCLCSGDVGGHVVDVLLVATSREPVSEGGQLVTSKDVMPSGDSSC